MRIKQKELIGKIPQVTYTKTLPNKLVVIAQVFDNPKCVNIIKKVNNKVTERQCYTLTDDMYQKYIDSYNKYGTRSQVDDLFATKSNCNCIKTIWNKIRRYIWN